MQPYVVSSSEPVLGEELESEPMSTPTSVAMSATDSISPEQVTEFDALSKAIDFATKYT